MTGHLCVQAIKWCIVPSPYQWSNPIIPLFFNVAVFKVRQISWIACSSRWLYPKPYNGSLPTVAQSRQLMLGIIIMEAKAGGKKKHPNLSQECYVACVCLKVVETLVDLTRWIFATSAEAIAMMWTSSDLISYHPASFQKSKVNRVKCRLT